LEYDDWLYTDEAIGADVKDIKKKIYSILDIVEPAEKRYDQW